MPQFNIDVIQMVSYIVVFIGSFSYLKFESGQNKKEIAQLWKKHEDLENELRKKHDDLSSELRKEISDMNKSLARIEGKLSVDQK